jgi:hypothetical protein
VVYFDVLRSLGVVVLVVLIFLTKLQFFISHLLWGVINAPRFFFLFYMLITQRTIADPPECWNITDAYPDVRFSVRTAPPPSCGTL